MSEFKYTKGYISPTLLTPNFSLGGSERERKRSPQRILQKSSIYCRLRKCRTYYRGLCRPSPSAGGHGLERDRVHRRRCFGWYVIYSLQLLFVRPQNNFLFLLEHNYRFISSQHPINILWGTHFGIILDIPVDRSHCGASRRDSSCWCIDGFGRWSFVFNQDPGR